MEQPETGLQTRARAVAQVLVSAVGDPQLGEADHHHLSNVLRTRNGEAVAVTDGRGSWCMTEWRDGSLTAAGDVFVEPRPSGTAVAFALTKGDKPEWTVQKLTEIGVGRIVPFVAVRSIVKWDESKAAKNLERFRRIAVEASMQCRRVWLPVVNELSTAAFVLEEGFAAAAPGGKAPTGALRSIAVGPEGGWTGAELAKARETVDFGPTILRAETAALVAGVTVTRR